MNLWSYIYYRFIFEDIRSYDLLECFLFIYLFIY